jgi:hypothetical protein
MTDEALVGLMKVDHDDLVADLWLIWQKHRTATLLEPVAYQKVSVVATSHVAAVTAVDCKMTLDQFINVCKANYQEAHKRAPKWS